MSAGVAVGGRWSLQDVAALNEEQFALWRSLLESKTGMTVLIERKKFLETSISMRLRELEFANYDDYYAWLSNASLAQSAAEWSVLVDRLTVQETSFFRHASSYALVEQFVSRWLAQKKSRSFSAWSVGCSTGEEPYSLAMLLHDMFEAEKEKFFFGINGNDISLPALSKARTAVFGARKLQMIRPEWQEKYFEKVNDREYQVVKALRSRIAFAQLNVVALNKSPMKNLDLIFCQNMLIYFRRWRKREIVTRLAERLAPGGLLVLGLGEIVDWEHPGLERVSYQDTLAFRRID